MRGEESKKRRRGSPRLRKVGASPARAKSHHSVKLDHLEKELKKTSGRHRRIATPKHVEGPHGHIEWRLSMLEGVLNAEQKARAKPTIRTSRAPSIIRVSEKSVPSTNEKKDLTVEKQAVTMNDSPHEGPVTFDAMADRLATEIIRRQGLEDRIVQLEDMIKSIIEKEEVGAIDVVSSEAMLEQPEPIQIQVQPRAVSKTDFTPQKVRSGTPRLDDLLLGGIPFGSNVLVYGPPFAGKELIVNSFVAEGVKWGTPILWLLSDRSPREIRAEMKVVFPEYEDAEKLGIIRYIDAYSRAVGSDLTEPYTEYVDSPTDFAAIQRLVEKCAREFKTEHDYYRMAVRGLSTLIAYSDARAVFKFLNSFVGKRKRDKAVTLYTIAKGVHTDHDIQMISSLMDGVIELKFENHETFMNIRGICDVRSRAYVRYALSKTGVEIGSFSLDHIR